jgi:hypothetical protein
MQNWGKFSLFAIRVMSEVQIVPKSYCRMRGVQLIRGLRAQLKAGVLNLACGAMVRKWTYLEDVLLPGWRHL